MTWLRVKLFKTFTIFDSLPSLDMDDHITVDQKCLQNQVVPSTPQVHVVQLTYIVHQPQQVATPTPDNKKTPSDQWDLQVMELLWLTNIPEIENVP